MHKYVSTQSHSALMEEINHFLILMTYMFVSSLRYVSGVTYSSLHQLLVP